MEKNKTVFKEGTFLDMILQESLSKEKIDKFNRGEARYTAANLAKISALLRQYRIDGKVKNGMQLTSENHSSKQLGKFLRANGQPRPGPGWEAHHLISGAHKEAAGARALLASEDIKIRIDDPDNGCWMPKTKKDARPTIYPNAIPHSRIHRERYYNWIFNLLFGAQSDLQAGAILNVVRMQILQGNLKDEILQSEIDEAEYKTWSKLNK